jgi:hypothetical protein
LTEIVILLVAFSQRGGTGGEKYGDGRYGKQTNPFERICFHFLHPLSGRCQGWGNDTTKLYSGSREPTLSFGQSVRCSPAVKTFSLSPDQAQFQTFLIYLEISRANHAFSKGNLKKYIKKRRNC